MDITKMFDVFNVALVSSSGGVRPVLVPADSVKMARHHTINALLDLIWHYGQNDFQPMPFPSVSVGDVIVIRNPNDECDINMDTFRLYRVDPAGFTPMTPYEYGQHVANIQMGRCR